MEACTELLSNGEYSAEDRTNFLLWRGQAYRSLGETQKASADVARVLKSDPNHTNALILRGYLREEAGRFHEAISDLSRAVSVEPQNAVTFKRRAVLYYNHGKLDLALADYVKALELDPTYEEVAGNIANVLFVQERYDEAIEKLRGFVAKWPDNAGLQVSLGFLVYNHTDEYGETLEAFYKYDELLPGLVSKYILPAMVYFKAGEPQKARKLIEVYAEKLDEKNRQEAPAVTRLFRAIGLEGGLGRDIQIFYRSQALARADQIEAAMREYSMFEQMFGTSARIAASEELLRNGVSLDKKRATQDDDYFFEKLNRHFTELSKLGNW